MQRECKRIADQLKRSYQGEAWHGPSLTAVLEGVTAEQAAARPLADAHSIWELVLHITAWQREARRGLLGGSIDPSDEEDWPAVEENGQKAWAKALRDLGDENRSLRETVAALQDEDLESQVGNRAYSVYFLLHGVVQHNLYHAGQIILLKKALSG
ncbi:MAG TPA: DinB family protein [Acidobacteriota bacterium]|nr:DinB family protein [Acidobacteriota bacterium]